MRTAIKLAVLGQLPPDFDYRKLLKWKSSVFHLSDTVESFELNKSAQGTDWEYTDKQLKPYLTERFDEDLMLILVKIKLEQNWYVRRLSGNRVIFSFFEIAEILRSNGIPLHNVVLRVLYAYTLVYKRYKNRIPLISEHTDYAHDETRGCLFDMNPSKWDVVYSCDSPKICQHCVSVLRDQQVSLELIDDVSNEIKRIKKPLYYRITDFIIQHPVWSLMISLGTALGIGIVSSIIGAFIYKALEHKP